MSGTGGGPSDEKDGQIKALLEENARLKAASQPIGGHAGEKAARKERESVVQKIFGKWGRR